MLVDSGQGLRAQVTALQQSTHQYFTDITSQWRQRAVACVNDKDKHSLDQLDWLTHTHIKI